MLIFILQLKVAWCWFLDLKMARFMRQVTLSPTSKTVGFTGIISIDLVGSVEIRDRNENRGIVVPLALGRDGRRPVPAARRARMNTGVRADGLARDRGHALGSRNLLDHGFARTAPCRTRHNPGSSGCQMVIL